MPDPAIDESFRLAIRLQQSGRSIEAQTQFREILAREPGHLGALHALGTLAHQSGRNDLVVELFRRIVSLEPRDARAFNNLGVALLETGQMDQAIDACRSALALRPNYTQAHINLGNALARKGEADAAIAAFRRALALQPESPQAWSNLGNLLKDRGELDEAIAAHRRAIAIQPGFAAAYRNLGNTLLDKGHNDQAVSAYRQAIALDPTNAQAHLNLGYALKELRQMDQAIAEFRQAIALQPDDALAHNNLGSALKELRQIDPAIAEFRQAITLQPGEPRFHSNLGGALEECGRFEEAIAACRQALALQPDYVDALSNLGAALSGEGHVEGAIAAYRQAIALQPDFVDAHHNLSFSLLLRGEFPQGWDEYEWRWKKRSFTSPSRSFDQPQWDGKPLAGATILIHAEQGIGDTLQFVRYLPMVAERGGKIAIECQPHLLRLLRSQANDYTVVAQGEALPAFDLHCALLSLPRIFGTTLENIPAKIPYLHASAKEVSFWRDRLASDAAELNVGLCWAGNPAFRSDALRSVRELHRLSPLARAKSTRFISLQKGEAARQTSNPPTGMNLVDWTDDLHDFIDTAALLANLDLMISSDTAVAHLAGAMGRPAWIMLPYASDWRWQLEREDCPWYSSMRLFRQPAPGDWKSVIDRVAHELVIWTANRR